MKKIRVLVYGTLKKGGSNHRLLSESSLISSGLYQIPNAQLKLPEGYAFPFLYKDSSQKSIPFYGEIFEITPETLKRLDHLEGHPDFYTREYIDSLDCFIYFCQNRDLKNVETIENF